MPRSKGEAYEAAGFRALRALREAERRFKANPQAGALAATPDGTRRMALANRCVYCGGRARPNSGSPGTCRLHSDLPALDPTDSKYGRWLVDAVYGRSEPARADVVRGCLNRDALARLAAEESLPGGALTRCSGICSSRFVAYLRVGSACMSGATAARRSRVSAARRKDGTDA